MSESKRFERLGVVPKNSPLRGEIVKNAEVGIIESSKLSQEQVVEYCQKNRLLQRSLIRRIVGILPI